MWPTPTSLVADTSIIITKLLSYSLCLRKHSPECGLTRRTKTCGESLGCLVVLTGRGQSRRARGKSSSDETAYLITVYILSIDIDVRYLRCRENTPPSVCLSVRPSFPPRSYGPTNRRSCANNERLIERSSDDGVPRRGGQPEHPSRAVRPHVRAFFFHIYFFFVFCKVCASAETVEEVSQ